MTETVHMETHGFQTEVKQLLNLMAHSLYSNKEVFLRELILHVDIWCAQSRLLLHADEREGGLQSKVQFGVWVVG